jgi:hypothetical protein
MYDSEIPETNIEVKSTFSRVCKLLKYTSAFESKNRKITMPTIPAEKIISRIALCADTAHTLRSWD